MEKLVKIMVNLGKIDIEQTFDNKEKLSYEDERDSETERCNFDDNWEKYGKFVVR